MRAALRDDGAGRPRATRDAGTRAGGRRAAFGKALRAAGESAPEQERARRPSRQCEATPDDFLRVTGDSLDKAGVHSGDIVAMRRQPETRNGNIVVAQLGREVTLKRYERVDARRVELQPASTSPEHRTIAVGLTSDDSMSGTTAQFRVSRPVRVRQPARVSPDPSKTMDQENEEDGTMEHLQAMVAAVLTLAGAADTGTGRKSTPGTGSCRSRDVNSHAVDLGPRLIYKSYIGAGGLASLRPCACTMSRNRLQQVDTVMSGHTGTYEVDEGAAARLEHSPEKSPPRGLTIAEGARSIMSAEPPSRRAAEPPSRRAAEPPSRRAAEPPSRRAHECARRIAASAPVSFLPA